MSSRNKRILVPEMLDELPPDHPDALRSRRDIRIVNRLMGNFSWLEKKLAGEGLLDGENHIVELGAGDGALANLLHSRHPAMRFTGIDLVPRPPSLPESIGWFQGDVLDALPVTGGDVLLSNHFLHHLTDEELTRLGKLSRSFRVVLSSEPARTRWSRLLARFCCLLGFNYVTRFDMRASIDAGFVGEELAEAMGLREWRVESRQTAMGAHRMLAIRRD